MRALCWLYSASHSGFIDGNLIYPEAMLAVLPQFQKRIRYRDAEIENRQIAKRRKELLEFSK